MDSSTIYWIVITVWVMMAFITLVAIFGEDEWPEWPKKPFEWIVDDRLMLSLVSARFSRRYRELKELRIRSPRVRGPPVLCTNPDGLHWLVHIAVGCDGVGNNRQTIRAWKCTLAL